MPTTAAQIIARVRADGVAQFVGGMGRAEKAVDRLGKASKNTSKIMASFASGGKTSSPLLAISGLLAGGAGIGFIKFLADSGKEMDIFRRRFAAFQGSFAQADRTIAFIRDLAVPSVFEFRDLARAGGLLAAYGFNVQRVLPLAEQLASAFGDDAEAVSEIARAFGRIKGGEFGEALDRLRDFGISMDDLQKKGLKFSRGNEFLGNRMQFLAATAEIITEKFGTINAYMRDSAAARFASAMDSVRSAAAEAGMVLLQGVIPAVERLTNFINFMRESGGVSAILQQWASSFQQLFGTSVQEGIDRVMAFIAAFAYEFPSAIVTVRNYFRDMFINITNGAADIYNAFVEIGVGIKNTFMTAVVEVKNFIGNIVTDLKNALIDIQNVGIRFDNANPFTGDRPLKSHIGFRPETFTPQDASQSYTSGDKIRQSMGDFFSKDFAGLNNTADRVFNAFGQYRPSGGGAGGTGGSFLASGNDGDLMSDMRRTEENTRRTADATEQIADITRNTLGGGNLGARGVSSAEFGSFRGSHAPKATVELRGNYDSVKDMFQDIAEQVYTQAFRSGQLAGRR